MGSNTKLVTYWSSQFFGWEKNVKNEEIAHETDKGKDEKKDAEKVRNQGMLRWELFPMRM